MILPNCPSIPLLALASLVPTAPAPSQATAPPRATAPPQAPGRAPRGGGGSVVLALARAADGDRSGEVSKREWQAFVRTLPADPKTGIDRRWLVARALLPLLDRDADGIVKSVDLDRLFVARDVDRSGVLSAEEVRRRGPIMETVLLHNADLDGDGEIPAVEWTRFLGACKAATGVTWATARKWLDRSLRPSAADRTAFTPAVSLLTFEAELDADRNGRVDAEDLRRIHAALDADHDGVLQKAELAARARPRSGAGGTAGRAARVRTFQVSAADRRKPPRMPWQRSLDDALALVAKTGKPLLVCVNMDGEPASESLAWQRYRDPKFAELASGFVPILVSMDRHLPVDFDERGRRLEDRKFGRLVDAEHMTDEPRIFAKYFGGRRVAPRHIGIDKDGKTLFDIYLTNDLRLIDAGLAQHGVRDGSTRTADRTEAGLLRSPDASDRSELEQRFLAGARGTRVRLAGRAFVRGRDVQHPGLLQLALHDDESAVRRAGVRAVAANPDLVPQPLFYRALELADADAELGDALLRGLYRAAADPSLDAATRKPLAYLQRLVSGLQASSVLVPARSFKTRLAGVRAVVEPPPDAGELPALDARLDELERALRARPDDRGLRLAMAAATLRYARIRIAQGKDPTLLLQDVRAAARRATSEAAPDGFALAHLAVACRLLREPDTIDCAARAVRALAEQPDRAASAIGAAALHVFARARTDDLEAAVRADREWPASWLADILAAYDVLADHPAATEAQLLDYAKFTSARGLWAVEERALRRGLARFPESLDLHSRFRAFALAHRGPSYLEQSYVALLRDAGSTPARSWYAGLASLMAAERYAVTGRRPAALAAYARSVARFGKAMREEPRFTDNSNHYLCLAHAGVARLHLEAGRLDAACGAITAAIAARPGSMRSRDGLGVVPVTTANRVLEALRAAPAPEKAAELRAALRGAGLLPKSAK